MVSPEQHIRMGGVTPPVPLLSLRAFLSRYQCSSNWIEIYIIQVVMRSGFWEQIAVLVFFFRDVFYKYLVPSFVHRVVKFGS